MIRADPTSLLPSRAMKIYAARSDVHTMHKEKECRHVMVREKTVRGSHKDMIGVDDDIE